MLFRSHHKHILKEVDNGVEMTDIIHYKIPMGFIGDLLNNLFIKKQLLKIFSYRFEKLNKLIGTIAGQNNVIDFKKI